MMLVPCYLAPSSIEGLGVYSTQPILKGDIVWAFDDRFDRLIPKDEIASAPEHLRIFFERYCYDMPNSPDCLALDADEGRFMNHADLPNLDFSSPDRGIALRDIPAGEELTCDYREFTVGEVVFLGPRHHVSKANGVAHH
ncbi:SET domain-containing protein [Parvularcula marina]|uniref:SET domain-containing protein n=1 Tax=Parvularcula marina TaxID=2292771 RepID=A0A371RJE1_9PROT|nr:SET domain-containing protein [Parvularcula marina]RFB05564.1 SET domain-containing protein [Parvularcula marina]